VSIVASRSLAVAGANVVPGLTGHEQLLLFSTLAFRPVGGTPCIRVMCLGRVWSGKGIRRERSKPR
jgi:hypothetical protein